MSLKNFAKIELLENQKHYWKLLKLDGEEVNPFTDFTKFLADRYAFATRDKYAQVVSKFLDYIVEINLFEQPATKLEFRLAIDNYKLLLRLGNKTDSLQLNKIAEELDIQAIAPKSWSNTLAGINHFLKFCFEKADEEKEYLEIKHKISLPSDYKQLLPELYKVNTLTHHQVQAMKQKSFLSHLRRQIGDIEVTQGLKSPVKANTLVDMDKLDFPATELPKLLSKTTSHRDRAIYALLAGTGIRSSEALVLTWDSINIQKQEIYIADPQKMKGIGNVDKMKFKGRTTAHTFFIPELKHIFFNALYEYQKNEATFPSKHNFIFQFLTGQKRGNPYHTVTREGFIGAFKRTVERANILPPNFNKDHSWTPHSLRHFYGVYMLNYIPLEKGFGFSLEEVQRMMGHKSVLVTQHYAKKPLEHIQAQLEYAESNMSGVVMGQNDFHKLIAQKYLEKSEELKKLENS